MLTAVLRWEQTPSSRTADPIFPTVTNLWRSRNVVRLKSQDLRNLIRSGQALRRSVWSTTMKQHDKKAAFMCNPWHKLLTITFSKTNPRHIRAAVETPLKTAVTTTLRIFRSSFVKNHYTLSDNADIRVVHADSFCSILKIH